MRSSVHAYVKNQLVRFERVTLSAMLLLIMSGPAWAENLTQPTADSPASVLNQELGIDSQSEGSEVGSRAVGKPVNPAMMPQKLHGAMPPRTWDALWAISWKRATTYYRIQAAPTTLHDPMCASPLMLDVFVRDTIQAIAIRKYGDAARFMSQFQDRSLCLTREGVRGVEFALSFYLHHALTSLPPAQARTAVQGVVNLGMLTFDQLQYTRRSWWLLTIMSHVRMMGPHMVDYPRADLGLLLYDPKYGLMLKSRFPDALDRFIGAMRRVENFGNGTCALIDMSEEGFVCQDDWAGIGSTPKTGSGNKTDRFPRMPDTIPPNAAACVLQSVQVAGVRGTMACMSKAMAGFTYNPRMGLQDKTIPDTGQTGIRDKMCGLGEEAGGDGTGGANANEKAGEVKEPSTWDKFKDGVSKVGEAIKDGAEKAWDFVKDVFDTTPPVLSELGQGASKEGADAQRGGIQAIMEKAAKDHLGKTGDIESYYQEREGRVVTDPQAFNNQRLAGDGTSAQGGKCSVRSNAAARAKSLYQCIDKPATPNRYANPSPESMQPGGQQPPPSGEKTYTIVGDRLVEAHSSTKAGGGTRAGAPTKDVAGGPPPTLDPNLIYVDPTLEQMVGPTPGGSNMPTGPMACMMQAGDLVRASLNDPRCNSLKRCVGNQPCPCDRQAPPSGMQPEKFGNPSKPNCADGQCDKPDPMGTPNPPPKPTFNFGGPPAPSPGPAPGSPPK